MPAAFADSYEMLPSRSRATRTKERSVSAVRLRSPRSAATTNRGGVTVSGIESIEGAYLRLGGIVGFAYPGTVLSNLTNAGDMTVDLQSKFSYYAVGGIAGSVECGASSCVNEGSLR